ncbi:unnamed protein product [Cylicocyclus nassatus]|uniref:Uncharacterized protein n=1 Tax=Cylicocyclus nassatus TaxID=53992 RepID=A0AA36GTR4_CYLNA|nr:unnamed protein product [Cylicocyclus nassatus]
MLPVIVYLSFFHIAIGCSPDGVYPGIGMPGIGVSGVGIPGVGYPGYGIPGAGMPGAYGASGPAMISLFTDIQYNESPSTREHINNIRNQIAGVLRGYAAPYGGGSFVITPRNSNGRLAVDVSVPFVYCNMLPMVLPQVKSRYTQVRTIGYRCNGGSIQYI